MLIYRCDRCHEDFENKGDLLRVQFDAEFYDDSKGMHCYCRDEIYRTGAFEVCRNCAAIFKANFIKRMEENN